MMPHIIMAARARRPLAQPEGAERPGVRGRYVDVSSRGRAGRSAIRLQRRAGDRPCDVTPSPTTVLGPPAAGSEEQPASSDSEPSAGCAGWRRPSSSTAPRLTDNVRSSGGATRPASTAGAGAGSWATPSSCARSRR
jgi:hypothetical protein